mmetsp:Transcript_15386/g.44472  ORF Transcript_15386/g.44472 Transcript_15386/m.44472 type:complete len:103 (+) Transcript_15386:1139-1447(+)
MSMRGWCICIWWQAMVIICLLRCLMPLRLVLDRHWLTRNLVIAIGALLNTLLTLLVGHLCLTLLDRKLTIRSILLHSGVLPIRLVLYLTMMYVALTITLPWS